MAREIILASASPRRREILAAAGIPFRVCEARVEERYVPGETPEAYVLRLARAKAEAVAQLEAGVILAADTVVLLDDHILEKPADRDEARRMLDRLSGREHEVLTGFCILHNGRAETGAERTRVRFIALTEAEIAAYAATGEPLDKAGAYAIQGFASKFIDRIDGCYFNVVGLPVARVYERLRALGLPG